MVTLQLYYLKSIFKAFRDRGEIIKVVVSRGRASLQNFMEFVFCSTRKFTKINKTLILANVSFLEKVSLSLTLQFLIRMIFNILFGVGYPRFLDLLSVLK